VCNYRWKINEPRSDTGSLRGGGFDGRRDAAFLDTQVLDARKPRSGLRNDDKTSEDVERKL